MPLLASLVVAGGIGGVGAGKPLFKQMCENSSSRLLDTKNLHALYHR